MADDVQPDIVVPMGAAPAEPEPRKGGCLRSCAIALIVFVGVLAFSGACAWFAFDAIDRSLTQERLESLSEREALAALNSAGLEPPDLSQYAYVTADGLQGPRFTDVTIGDTVMRSSLFAALLTNDNAVQLEDPFLSYRVVSAFATWRSSAIEVRRFVVQRFVFDLDKNTWQTTTSELGAPTVTPVRAPNVRSFQEGLIPLLRFYDSRLAEAFADATVRVTSESLTAQGGTFEASLEKGSAVCTVTYEVQWSEADGWILSVKEVDSSRAGRLPAATVPVAITPQPLAGGGQDQPAQQMVCHADGYALPAREPVPAQHGVHAGAAERAHLQGEVLRGQRAQQHALLAHRAVGEPGGLHQRRQRLRGRAALHHVLRHGLMAAERWEPQEPLRTSSRHRVLGR